MSRSRRLVSIAAAVAVAVLLVSCASQPTPRPEPTPAASLAPSGDGVLRIGTAFPATGSLAGTGPAQVAGVEAAVREINEAGGVLGTPVQVFHRDSGDDATEILEASFADLMTKSIDVFIGPAGSGLTERIVPAAADARIPVIAPGPVGSGELNDDGYLFVVPPHSGGADSVSYSAEPDAAFMARVRMSDPGVTDFRYAAEAYDAVMIAALAAILAEDDGGASLAARIDRVTTGGIPCASFGECLDVLETEPDILYGSAVELP